MNKKLKTLNIKKIILQGGKVLKIQKIMIFQL